MNHRNLLTVVVTVLLATASTPASAASWCTKKGCFCEGMDTCTTLFASDQCKPLTTHLLPQRAACDGSLPPRQGWCEVSETAVLAISAKAAELRPLMLRWLHY
jgi:hypothetical protein